MAYELYRWAYIVLEVGFSMFINCLMYGCVWQFLLNKHDDDDDDHHVEPSLRQSANSITSICCRFVVQQVVQQIHNILTCRRTCDQHNNASPRFCWSQVVAQQIHNKS